MDARFFVSSEFDSTDLPGSGELMCEEFISMLDSCRLEAGIPFVINSGFRTASHNEAVNGVSNSVHLEGKAADVRCTNSTDRFKIVAAALYVNIGRIGIADTFVHLDTGDRDGPFIWLY